MKIINIIKKIFGKIIYSKSIRLDEPLVLHLTDTPTTTYSEIDKLIKSLKPEYIVHTGDLADNIKIGLYEHRISEYKRKVKSLLDLLENSDGEIYITIGNHDHEGYVQQNTVRSKIIHKFQKIDIEGSRFVLVHNLADVISEKCVKEADYVLCGHSYEYDDLIPKNKLLNGLKGIFLIYPQSNKVYQLDYPIGTDDSRMQKFRIGI